MHIDLSGKVALISGAAQGIGQSIAQQLQASGATIILVDIDEDRLTNFAREIEGNYVVIDLGNRRKVQTSINELMDRFGKVDIVVHAAGGTRGQAGAPIHAIDEAAWRAIFAANVDGAFWLAQACAPGMQKRQSGRFIAIASGAGLRPSLTGIQAYTAAKHALVGLVRQLSWEFGPYGITVNAIAPGFILSNPTTERQWQAMGKSGQKHLLDSIHLRRLGSAADIARAATFLASEEANWITGQVLSVDGGRS